MRKKLFTTAISLLFVQGIAAQDSLRTTTLQEVVVSASRSQQRIIDVPRSINIINRDNLDQAGYLSIGDLLSRQAGIYVVGANQTPGTNQSLFLRGANSNQVVVMIDGVRVNDPSTPNATIDLSELSLSEVEQIEIVEGSHSTLYGGGAIGGVVNIITRKRQREGVSGTATLTGGLWSGGTFFSESANLQVSGKSGLYFNGAVMNQTTGGLNSSGEKGYFKRGDNDGFHKTDVFAKAGYQLHQWDVSIAYKKAAQRAELDNGAFADDDNAFLKFNRDKIDFYIGYSLGDQWKFTATSSWSKSVRFSKNDSSKIDAVGNYDGSFLKDRYYGRIVTNEAQINYTTERLSAVAGLGHYGERMWFNTYYFSNAFGFPYESRVNYDSINTQTNTSYFFAQATHTFNNFSLAAGSRFSRHSRFGGYWTAEVSPSYRWGSMLLYASVSTGFNPASLYQLYDPSKGYGAITTRGNKNLKAEESTSIEVGIKKEFSSGNHFTLSAFRNDVKNAIEYVYLWNKETAVQELTYADFLGDTYLNITQQQVMGVEASMHVTVGKFYLQSNVTFLKGELSFKPTDIDKGVTEGHHVQLFNYGSFVTEEFKVKRLVRRPQLTTNVEAGFKPNSKITINVFHRYAGSRFDSGYDPVLGPFGALTQFRVDSYHLTDIGISGRVTQRITLGVRVENIFDRHYHEIIGFETRGRTAYAKLQYKF